MVVVLSMAAAAATSTDMVPPTVMQNKHQIRYRRRIALGDGCGAGTTGFAPASETKSLLQSIAPAARRIG